MTRSSNTISDILYLILFMAVSAITALYYCPSISPLSVDTYSVDSDIFKIIGKGWNSGEIPYIDLWDSKGPLVFLVNAIFYGWLSPTYGLYIFQSISFGCTLFIAWKTLRLYFRALPSSLLTLIIVFFRFNHEVTGNSVNDIDLPFIFLSFYLISKWLLRIKSGNINIPASYAFFIGLTFGICAMCRLSDALSLVGPVIIIAITLCIHRLYRNLIHCLSAGIIGLITVTLPFGIYFAIHSALYDMIYGTFIYNLSYISHPVRPSYSALFLTFRIYLRYYGIIIACCLFNIYCLCHTRKRDIIPQWIWLSSALPLLTWLLTGNVFSHYSVLSLPYLCITINEIRSYINTKNIQTALFAMFTLSGLAGFGLWSFKRFPIRESHTEAYSIHVHKFRQLVNHIPQSELQDQTLLINTPGALYLKYNISPPSRFFTLQNVYCTYNPNLMPIIEEDYSNISPIWIISSNTDSLLIPLTNKHNIAYIPIDSIDGYFLLKRHVLKSL